MYTWFGVRDKVGTWPWSSNKVRVIETAMARLRLGHAGVNAHLHRFGMKNTESCECGDPETIEHFLLNCTEHLQHRDVLQNMLTNILGLNSV